MQKRIYASPSGVLFYLLLYWTKISLEYTKINRRTSAVTMIQITHCIASFSASWRRMNSLYNLPPLRYSLVLRRTRSADVTISSEGGFWIWISLKVIVVWEINRIQVKAGKLCAHKLKLFENKQVKIELAERSKFILLGFNRCCKVIF